MLRLLTSLLLLTPVTYIHAHSIKHVIVLMMENRSFDHMLGYLHQNNSNINGLKGDEYNLMDCTNPSSTKVMINSNAAFSDPDPDHSVQSITQQIYCEHTMNDSRPTHPGDMSGFVTNAVTHIPGHAETVMSCFNENTVPILTQLAREYAVFDAWHASVPGQTQLNRMYANSATSYGDCNNDDIVRIIEGYPQKTIFEQLDEAGYTWAIYYEDIASTLFHEYVRLPQNWGKMLPMSAFFEHAANNTLPNYVWLEPRYFEDFGLPASDQHPSHDVAEGEKLIKSIYEAVHTSPAWNNTLFMVTYDEHGGFYDHVVPTVNIPNPDGRVCSSPEFDFTRIGVRVPTIAISPWIAPGSVIHTPINGPTPNSQYEHTSIMATMRAIFNMTTPLNARDAWAATFENILTLDSPRTNTKKNLGHVHSLRHWGLHGERDMNDLQKSWVRLGNVLNTLARGSTNPAEVEDTPQIIKEGDGGRYVMSAMTNFIDFQRRQFESQTQAQIN